MTKGCHTSRDGDDEDYAPTPLALVTAAATSDSEPVVPFGFRGQEDVSTEVRYTEIAFSLFSRGYLLVLLGLYSSSLFLSFSSGAGTNKDVKEDLVELQGACGDDSCSWSRYQVRYVADHCRKGWKK